MALETAVMSLIAYVAGSLPVGVLITRALTGVDIRAHGSGNIGTANAVRVSGWKTGLIVMVADILKGALPVIAVSSLAFPQLSLAAVGAAAVLGHNWSVFLGFRGGKGAATSLGVVFVLAPLVALGLMVIWFAVVFTTRYSSLASLTALTAAPFFAWFTHQQPAAFYFTLIAAALGIFKHRENIVRLLKGTENRISRKGGAKEA